MVQRGLRRERTESGFQGEAKGLVAVELSDGEALVRRRPEEGRCGLEVILAKGRRIELSRDFDAVQLRRAIEGARLTNTRLMAAGYSTGFGRSVSSQPSCRRELSDSIDREVGQASQDSRRIGIFSRRQVSTPETMAAQAAQPPRPYFAVAVVESLVAMNGNLWRATVANPLHVLQEHHREARIVFAPSCCESASGL
jgi:hypothetical protein